MTILDIVIYLAVAAICAGIAESLLGIHIGCLASIVVGLVGAYVGTLLARKVGLPDLFVLQIGNAQPIPIIWTIVGAFLLLFVVSLFRRGVRT